MSAEMDALRDLFDSVKAAKDERLGAMGWDEGHAWSKVARALDRAKPVLFGEGANE